MKELVINRHLDEDTRKQSILINGVVYSLRITNNEVIITVDDCCGKCSKCSAFVEESLGECALIRTCEKQLIK